MTGLFHVKHQGLAHGTAAEAGQRRDETAAALAGGVPRSRYGREVGGGEGLEPGHKKRQSVGNWR